jgi:hypothetical protein
VVVFENKREKIKIPGLDKKRDIKYALAIKGQLAGRMLPDP